MNKNITIGFLLVIVIGLIGFLLYKNQNNSQSISEIQMNTIEDSNSVSKENNQEISNTKEYKNTDLGISFNYIKEFGDFTFEVGPGTTGKLFFGNQGCEIGDTFCMRVGGVTSNFTYPGELEAYMVFEYPSNERLQSLSTSGYKNEKKINSMGQEYIIIYSKKEVDMPYIGEGQAVALFKLKSSKDFGALGFMLISGDVNKFQTVLDSVNIN